jgi:serine/threonine-protein phosphatase 2A regulatory subunit A
MEAISEASGSQGIEAHVWPMWLRLSQGAFFISKASAASLAADVYAGVGRSAQADLRKAFASSVCLDECPIVRRAAVPALSRLIPLCSGEGSNGAIEGELWPLFETLASDAQDSVRLLVPEVALAFGDVWPASQIESKLLPVLLRLAGDRSWRVRYVVAASFPGIMERIVGAVVMDRAAVALAVE